MDEICDGYLPEFIRNKYSQTVTSKPITIVDNKTKPFAKKPFKPFPERQTITKPNKELRIQEKPVLTQPIQIKPVRSQQNVPKPVSSQFIKSKPVTKPVVVPKPVTKPVLANKPPKPVSARRQPSFVKTNEVKTNSIGSSSGKTKNVPIETVRSSQIKPR